MARQAKTLPPNRTDVKKLTGPEKAAILFLCLGEERGSDLMKQLSVREIEKITRAMSVLGLISAKVAQDVVAEFTHDLANGGGLIGSVSVAEKMLHSFLPANEVASIMNKTRVPIEARLVWDRFSAMNENLIANYLKSEHAQTAAAILSKVSPDVCAKVLPLLGEERMQDVVERMISLEAVPFHMMRQIEETLQNEIVTAGSQPSAPDVQQRMADLFNRLDRDLFERLSNKLDETVPETLGKIKQKMFTFDDLSKLDQQSIAQVIRNVTGNTLPMALRGATKEMREHFLGALPSRSRDMLSDEMASMGPVRGSEVRAAQTLMVETAKELADAEVIMLPISDDDQLIE